MVGAMRALPALALLCPSRALGDMEALVATSASERGLARFPMPELGDLRRKFVDLPKSCEVLVAVSASSVNPADRSTPGPFPQVMGSDLAGTVLAVEENCTRLAVGDRVWADIGAVAQTGGGKGKENGAYAQVAVALESQLGPMPKNLGFREAAALPKVALTSYKALAWYGGAPYRNGNGSVLILGGSGGTGTTGIQLAKALGASSIATTTSAANRDYVLGLGATKALDYRKENWWEVFPDGSLDVIYDTVGQKGTGDKAMQKIKSGGFYVTIAGALPTKPRDDVQSTMFINSNTNLDNFEILEKLRGFVESEQLRLKRFATFPLSEVLAAFDRSASGHVDGKLVIEVAAAESPQRRRSTELLF